MYTRTQIQRRVAGEEKDRGVDKATAMYRCSCSGGSRETRNAALEVGSMRKWPGREASPRAAGRFVACVGADGPTRRIEGLQYYLTILSQRPVTALV